MVKEDVPVAVNPADWVIAPVFAVAFKFWKDEVPVNAILEAFKSTVDTLLVELMVSTVIAPAVLSPMVNVLAVILPISVSSIVMVPAVAPNPTLPPLDTRIVVFPAPELTDPARAKSLAVIESAFPPVDKVPAVLLKLPVPSLSESAFNVVAPPVVTFTL